ncbi:MAG: helix-turn-helix domain-containing protein [Muribaculaceae bacterium]|nr:helix-turn-helix domain-containing protein [Muribaculaceae bacterium]
MITSIYLSNYQPNKNKLQPSFGSKTAAITTEYLMQLINSGKTVKEIKSELGIATDTYYKLLRERGISYKKIKTSPTPDITKEQLADLLSQGITVPKICEMLKITAHKYYRLVEKLGVKNSRTAKSENRAKVTAEALAQCVKKGMAVDDICKFFGISGKAYYDFLKKFGIKTPAMLSTQRNASITKEQIVKLIDAGKSVKEISAELGITESAYTSLVSKFGIQTEAKLAKQRLSGVTEECLRTLVTSGKFVDEICEKLNIPVRTYSRLLDKFGIITDRKAAKARVASIKKEELQALVDEGLTPKEISRRLNIPTASFYKLLKRLKIDYTYAHHQREIVIPKAKLEEAAASGKSVDEIAKDLGIATTTYHEKAKLAQVKTVFRDSIDNLNAIPKETIQKLLDSGESVEQICEKLNITKANYVALLRKYNLDTAQRRSLENIANISKSQVLELRADGKTNKEICTELNISMHTLRRILNANSGM